MDKDKIRQMAAVKAHMDWPPETEIWYAAYYAFIAGYEACEGKETPNEQSNCIKPAVIKSVCTHEILDSNYNCAACGKNVLPEFPEEF